ncbi:hypothetical protein Tco_1093756 [Tanacetum coccineum]|uniref:Uncharacterized protein n=1 Tax=Tanacetum coccineum TaxID=301880 RepID=A0ABQ5IDK6_9ASTR
MDCESAIEAKPCPKLVHGLIGTLGQGPEFTWEVNDQIQEEISTPLHQDCTVVKCRVISLEDKAHLTGEDYNTSCFRHGIDISYTKWTKHGEEDEPSISAPKPVNATIEFVDDMDFAYIPTDGPATVEMVNATKDNFDVDDLVKFQELLLDAKKPLYEGCPDFTKLSAIVKLLNLKGKYGASGIKFFTELQAR